jgi:hypothetical protein
MSQCGSVPIVFLEWVNGMMFPSPALLAMQFTEKCGRGSVSETDLECLLGLNDMKPMTQNGEIIGR